MKRNYFMLICVAIMAVEVKSVKAADSENESENAQRVRVLIEKLASSNPAPSGDGPVDLPRGYNKDAQVTVFLARQQLCREGSVAVDLLMQHLKDMRYSLTYETVSGNFNQTVGDTALQIVRNMVLCYEGEIDYISIDQNTDEVFKGQEIDAWWKLNRVNSLWKTQITAIDVEIGVLKALDYDTAGPVHPLAKKMDKRRFDSLKNHSIQVLENLRKTIRETRQPHIPHALDGPNAKMVGLPWYNGSK